MHKNKIKVHSTQEQDITKDMHTKTTTNAYELPTKHA